jgi:DNA repair exonuclease SbcCD nuclease subunit
MIHLFYSDLHIRPETLDTCDNVLSEIGRIAKHHNAVINNGGDTFNTRGLLKTSCLDLLTYHYQEWRRMKLVQNILIGNHDQEDRAGEIHPMRVFEEWEGWNVIDTPRVINGIAYFPYMSLERIEEMIEPVIVSAGKKAPKVALVHWGIKGAKRNDWNVDNEGVPVEWLKPFKKVFSGHYHFRNSFENVQYIGSPYQQNHSEANQAKGVLLYDTVTEETEFVEIKGTPKHHAIKYSITEKGKVEIEGDTKAIGEKDMVSVTIEGDSDQVNAVTQEDLKKHFKAQSVKMNRQGRVRSHSRLGITSTETLNPLTLAEKYVGFVDTSLDRKKLMETCHGLIHS